MTTSLSSVGASHAITTATSTVHPLDPWSPLGPDAGPSAASSSRESARASATSTRASSPIARSVRARKPTSIWDPPAPSSLPTTPDPALTGSRLELDHDTADITRPSLRKATEDALDLAGQGRASNGKGKQRDPNMAESPRTVSQRDREREVVVHKVLKTDTIASVSLQYGISQQALRKANRLWATDPIHFKATLLIPLDECNLPSSSFGLERIAREENGDITVWKRDGTDPSIASSSEAFAAAARRSDHEQHLVSPRARHLVPTSSLETMSHPTLTPESDFLAIWDDEPGSSSRPSLDSVRSSLRSSPGAPPSKHTFSLGDPISRFDPYPLHGQRDTRDLSASGTPDYASSTSQLSATFSPALSTSSLDLTPPSDTSSPNGSHLALAKRTLKVERLPASQLSFFAPPSSQSNSQLDVSTPKAYSAQTAAPESRGLFFGPLTNTLSSSFSSLNLTLNKYLGSTSTRGAIALPLSRTSSPHRSVSSGTASGWNLDYFGGEEDLLAHGRARRTTSSMSAASTSKFRKPNRQVGLTSLNQGTEFPESRRTSMIGLEEVGTSARSLAAAEVRDAG
ncbi:uncharacterized protein JCM15063_003133 [Sporobolomyces koalae]|uniref:uncharacterized protein n=1 Tax=Sporobolomyces koalae TaxID=500713 RepID=UPI00317F77EC